MLPTLLFWILAAMTAASAFGVVISQGIIRSAVYLLFTLVGVAMLYFLLGAEFLGAAQLMIYVGGTLVLVVFGGMLTAGGPFAQLPVPRKDWVVGGCVSIGLFVLLAAGSLEMGRTLNATPRELPGMGTLGMSFLGFPENPGKPGQSTYLLPFEIISIHLLVVLIGAAYLARAKSRRTAGGS